MIAEFEEVTEQERAMKKTRDYLVYFFGEANYDWVKANQCFKWAPEDENKIKTNKKVFSSAKTAVDEWLAVPESERVFPRPKPKKIEPPKAPKATAPKTAKRKRVEGDVTEDVPPGKKAKKNEDSNATEIKKKNPKPPQEQKPPKRRKLDIAPERGAKPTPEWKKVNGKLFSELPKEEKEAIEKRRWKRRALMRELGLWPPKGSPFLPVRSPLWN